MFDVGISELLLIGVVALIVIGPERLPKVARTVGLLVGRMQRYVATVKADLSQELQLDELRKSGQAFKDSLEQTGQHISNEVNEVHHSIGNAVHSTDSEIPLPSPPPTAEIEDNRQGELALEHTLTASAPPHTDISKKDAAL